MKYTFVALLILTLPSMCLSQSVVDWTPEYQLTLADFQSPQTEISSYLDSYSIFPGADIDFAFHMSNYEFMFTKNFNDKVRCRFNRKAAALTAPDSALAQQLVKYGQFNFDLTELLARRFRKELHEQKKAFSSVSFFQPIYDTLHAEMNALSARVLKQTNFGRDENLLREEHQKVLAEIEQLSDYCRDCKPPKRKKKR